MRISDWSSDVCSSDLCQRRTLRAAAAQRRRAALLPGEPRLAHAARHALVRGGRPGAHPRAHALPPPGSRSEEHTSELQSLMRISYAVFCLKKKKNITNNTVS